MNTGLKPLTAYIARGAEKLKDPRISELRHPNDLVVLSAILQAQHQTCGRHRRSIPDQSSLFLHHDGLFHNWHLVGRDYLFLFFRSHIIPVHEPKAHHVSPTNQRHSTLASPIPISALNTGGSIIPDHGNNLFQRTANSPSRPYVREPPFLYLHKTTTELLA